MNVVARLPTDLQRIVFAFTGKNRWPKPNYIYEMRKYLAWNEETEAFFRHPPYPKCRVAHWRTQQGCRDRRFARELKRKYQMVMCAVLLSRISLKH